MGRRIENEFDCDDFPNRPRLLFIGWPESSHTHSWIDLVKNEAFNVRLFCLPSEEPPIDWGVKSYVTALGAKPQNSSQRRYVFPQVGVSLTRIAYLYRLAESKGLASQFSGMTRLLPHFFKKFEQITNRRQPTSIEAALANVIAIWKPHVIHTLGIDPASYLLKRTRDTYLQGQMSARWIVQARGGPDLALKRFDPDHAPLIQEVITECNHFIADNSQNYDIAESLGLPIYKRQNPGLGVVSGAGGLDLEELTKLAVSGKTSERARVIVWPKAYEINSAKAMPVFEAIIKYWEQLQPCKIEMLWCVQSDIRMWYEKLFSSEMKKYCSIFGRLSRQETLERVGKARVLLAPSLSDGIPNAMMEAMALGAVPLVSPLDTITPVVRNEVNVLFAKNLYPDEIGLALVRLLNDDKLVDRMAENNKMRIQEIADRREIKKRVIEFYEKIAISAVHS